ncbi:transposase domain-containing protein [Sorangium cellulosum]|uniref:transposase domain-containing protein n=1 Tax=Sorangium cellulosum TaxID=56 RepID=UPI00040E620F|nr:transposase domain-containing protein [Sorangium cellulosum]
MAFRDALLAAADYVGPAHVDNICKHLPAEWIEQALAATGTATLRRRRLPAEQVIWLVLGMALMRDRPIEEVVTKLDLALPGANGAIARSAIPQARARLRDEPMQWLFERSALAWSTQSADANRYRGLAVYGIDGTTLRVADTPDNRAEFGGASSSRRDSGYPGLPRGQPGGRGSSSPHLVVSHRTFVCLARRQRATSAGPPPSRRRGTT